MWRGVVQRDLVGYVSEVVLVACKVVGGKEVVG